MTLLPRLPKPAAATLCASLLALLNQAPGAAAQSAPAPAANPAAQPAGAAPATSFDEVTARLDRGGSFYLYLSTSQWLDELSGKFDKLRDIVLTVTASSDKDTDKDKDKDEDDKDEDKDDGKKADAKKGADSHVLKKDADKDKDEDEDEDEDDGKKDSAKTQATIKEAFNLLVQLTKKSGVEQITGIGASSVALERGVNRNTVFVHHYKGKENGVLGTLFGAAPHALTALDYLPADTALATYGDFDVPLLIKTAIDTLGQSNIPEVKQKLDKGLKQFADIVGMPLDMLLKSIGGSEGLILTLDPTKKIEIPMADGPQSLPMPRMALLVQLRDDQLFPRIDKVLGGLPGLIKVDEPNLRMRTMTYPAMPDFTVRVTVAQWEKFLIVATDDSLIRDMIAAQKSGQGFKATPAFAKLSAGLPTEGNGFSLITQSFVDTWKKVQSEMLDKQAEGSPELTALKQKMMNAYQNVGTTYGVSAHVDNGWLSVSKSSQNMSQVLVPLALVPVAVAAGTALPVFQAVKEKSKATQSLSKIKQISLALKLYAGDNDGKYPAKLEDLMPTYTQAESLFVSPFAPDEPMGYTYKTGLTDSDSPDTIVLQDKYAKKDHKRIIAHLDCSAEVKKGD